MHDGKRPLLINRLLEAGDKEGALKWIDAEFEKDSDSDEAAFYFANLMAQSEHPGPAKFILEHLSNKHPKKWQAWQNMGYCLNELGEHDRALKVLRKAEKLHPEHPDILLGISSCYTHMHEWDKALEYGERAQALKPTLQAEINKAFALLCLGRYGEGWDLYQKGIGKMPWRDWHDYGLEDGLGPRTIVYAEQGIGDQIAFCSALPDAIRDGKVAALNCHPKLARLFRDSFDCPVYGDQFKENCGWIENLGATHQWPMSGLMAPYRRTEADFPKRPFLKVPDERQIQWRALFGDRPKIGICWSSGVKGSHAWKRKFLDTELVSTMLQWPVEWVSLEYKEGARPKGLKEYPWATLTADYADTAAMVSQLDAVVGPPTSVHHLAGALGVESHVLVHDRPHFHYAAGMPYYGSVHLHPRTREGIEAVKERILEIAGGDSCRTRSRGTGYAGNGISRDRDDVFDGSILGSAGVVGQ